MAVFHKSKNSISSAYCYLTAILLVEWVGVRLSTHRKGLPWWHSGWDSACWQETRVQSLVQRPPHAMGQPSLWATTTELMCYSYGNLRTQSLCSAQGEATATKSITAERRSPCSPQREEVCTQQQEDPVRPKVNKYIKLFLKNSTCL